MANLPLEKRILYTTIYCKYRHPQPNKIECRHPYSFRICDLNLCPIAQEYFANIVFLPEGITLVIKEPATNKVAGEWKKIPIEISPELDNEDDIIELIKNEASKINEVNMRALLERVHRIFQRYRFLKEKGKEIPEIEAKEVEEEWPEEELEEEAEEEWEEETEEIPESEAEEAEEVVEE